MAIEPYNEEQEKETQERKQMIKERLERLGVTETHYSPLFRQFSLFQAQIQAVFASREVDRILESFVLMVELHLDQAPRPDGTPYVEHPLAVACQVLDAMAQKDADLVVAALLHDSVEDQTEKLAQKAPQGQVSAAKSEKQLALDVIEWKTHSARVRAIVSSLTNPDFDALIKKKRMSLQAEDTGLAADTRARNEMYAAHVARALRNPDVALIKMFDFEANALHLESIPDEARRERYRSKYAPIFQIMIERLRERVHPINITPEKREEMLAMFII